MRLALAALAVALPLAGQDPQFDVQSRLVLVPATVTDSKGNFVDDLEPPDFIILDNGRLQRATVDTLATGVAPIALVVAVQTSGISLAVTEKMQKIGAMIQPLLSGERGCAALLAFDENVKWLQDCTNDQGVLAGAFDRLKPGELKAGRMLDAVDEAVKHLLKHPNSRRVLLLVSESRDRSSEKELEDVTAQAQAAGVTVYAATYSAWRTGWTSKTQPRGKSPEGRRPGDAPETLPNDQRVPIPGSDSRVDLIGWIREMHRKNKVEDTKLLTAATGGITFPFVRQRSLEEMVQKLSSELHSQYVLSFAPTHPPCVEDCEHETDAGFHRIDVRVTRPGEYKVRARPGYWSAPQELQQRPSK